MEKRQILMHDGKEIFSSELNDRLLSDIKIIIFSLSIYNNTSLFYIYL
jgi:hypothetical protein